MLTSLTGFIICSLLIVYAGSRLTKYADSIADQTGIGKSFIGIILMATVTSLPELVTGFTSVMILDIPEIAAGDVLGSCLFNLLILALLDPLIKNQSITTVAGQEHIITSMISIILLTLAASNIVFHKIIPAIGHISLNSFFLIILYFSGVRLLYLFERKKNIVITHIPVHNEYSLRHVIKMYLINAFLVIVAAFFLPSFAEEIARDSGLGLTFFGTLFIALSTSLPELVVSYSAVKIGSANLAIANIFGSNIFNMLILAMDDFLYTKGPILSHIKSSHLISVFSCIMITCFICIGIIFKQTRKRFFISYDSLIIILIYAAGMSILYFHK